MPGWIGVGVVMPLLGVVVVGGTSVLVVGLEVVDVVVGMLEAGPSTQ
jgi:hypothetical protein